MRLASATAILVGLLACVPALAQNVPPDFVTSGNITAVGQCITAYVGQGQNSAAVTLAGTWTGTVTFKIADATGASAGYSNSVVVLAIPRGGGVGISAVTANGTWVMAATATKQILVCASAAVTGTINVYIESSVTAVAPDAVTGGALPAGSNAIGHADSTSTIDPDANNETVVAVSSSAGGTTMLSARAARRALQVCNVDTIVLYCSIGNTPTAGTIYGFVLKADSAGGGTPKGDGGCQAVSQWAGTVTCVAASGTGHAAVMAE